MHAALQKNHLVLTDFLHFICKPFVIRLSSSEKLIEKTLCCKNEM